MSEKEHVAGKAMDTDPELSGQAGDKVSEDSHTPIDHHTGEQARLEEGEEIVLSEEFVGRKAPRFSVFIGGGCLIGVIISIALVTFGQWHSGYSTGAVIFATALVLVPVSGFFGALIALVLDRYSVKKSHR